MEVRPLAVAEEAAYDRLVESHGTLFNRRDWLALFGERAQPLGLFERGSRLVGGFSFDQSRRRGVVPVLRPLPFTPHCGPFFDPGPGGSTQDGHTQRRVVESLAEFLERQPALSVVLPLDPRIGDTLPFSWRGFQVRPQYTYLLDLATPLEQLRAGLSEERRRNIAKALRDGLVVRPTPDLRVVQGLVRATFERQHLPLDGAHLERILFHYATGENSFAFTTWHQAWPIATCFVLHDAERAYYLLGGYQAEHRHHGAGALAMFEAIKHAQSLGLRTFDFEGSVVPAIERFFRGFGGQLQPYFLLSRTWLPLAIWFLLRGRKALL